MLGWIILFRVIHCFMLWFNNRKIGANIGGPSQATAAPKVGPAGAALEMVVVHPPAALPSGTTLDN